METKKREGKKQTDFGFAPKPARFIKGGPAPPPGFKDWHDYFRMNREDFPIDGAESAHASRWPHWPDL